MVAGMDFFRRQEREPGILEVKGDSKVCCLLRGRKSWGKEEDSGKEEEKCHHMKDLK